jgi:hypothetical protein
MAAGVTISRQADFVTTPSRLLQQFRPLLFARMEKVLQEAVIEARQITASSPSAKSGKPGRIESGDMINDLGYRVWQNARGEIVGELGFPGTKQFYYYLQTQTGFRHWISGEFIEPTMAIQRASEHAFEKLLKSRV